MNRNRCLTLGVVLLLVSTGLGATYNLTDYMANPTFDMDPTTNGNNSPFVNHPSLPYDYRNLEDTSAAAGALGWYEPTNGHAFYIRSDSGTWEDSSPHMLGLESVPGGWYSLHQRPTLNIQNGDTVEFSFKYKKNDWGAADPLKFQILLWNGSTAFNVVQFSNFSTSWQEDTWSYTHSGSTLSAGSYVLSVDMYNDGSGYQAFVLDTFVPEPTTLCLLGVGSFLVIRKRKW